MMRRLLVAICGCVLSGAAPAAAGYIETPELAAQVAAGELPPVAGRLPEVPRMLDFEALGLEPGVHGGAIRTLMARAKDARQLTVYGYSRLLVREPNGFRLEPDILESVEVEEGRVFTFRLRAGHRWSDGHPFTADDFRYWWEDVANNPELSPAGPPVVMRVDGELARFAVLDNRTVQYRWSRPNPDFLPRLAAARPLYIYRPAHYLRRFHAAHADPAELEQRVNEASQRSWSALHNKRDNLYRNDNPDLPVLQPWRIVTALSSSRLVFRRNPYFHRVDPAGRQLPYVDSWLVDVANNRLIAAKAGTGEADLQARYLRFDDYTFLRGGEDRWPYETRLWQTAKGAHLALYPNLNVKDPVLRELMRDARFRRALSLAVHRHELNQVVYYGLALVGNNTTLPESPLYREENRFAWTRHDPDAANRLLDEIGLVERDSRGVRKLPDGRSLEIIVETAGESTEQTDVLELVHDSWLAVGIKLYSRPLERTVFRNRIFAGATAMSIWSGVENGLATPDSSPAEFAPTTQLSLQWPKWGQHYETRGASGEAPDLEPARELLALYRAWRSAADRHQRERAWRRMLEIHADQVFTIGLIAAVPQPVVVASSLRNVPERGIWNWDPGAHFGMYCPDTFWFGTGDR